jgi:hypothetical protein
MTRLKMIQILQNMVCHSPMQNLLIGTQQLVELTIEKIMVKKDA